MTTAFDLWAGIMRAGVESLSTGDLGGVVDALHRAQGEPVEPAAEVEQAAARPPKDAARCFGASGDWRCVGHTEAGGCILEKVVAAEVGHAGEG